MTTNPIRNVRWLLDQLEDPFTVFPIGSVATTLFKAVDEAEVQKWERMGPWGVSRKFWSVEEEHYHTEVGLLVGAIFVLGQAAITQTVSILCRLRELPEAEPVIPKDKALIVGPPYAATVPGLKHSRIAIINAVANYYKHLPEWSETWDPAKEKKPRAEAMRIVLDLGMSPSNEITDNLRHAAIKLGLEREQQGLDNTIQEWRENWARKLYPVFGLRDPNSVS